MSTAEIIETQESVARLFALSVILVFLTFSSAASGAEQDAGSIRGTVVDENNVPVAGARVNADPIDGRIRTSLIRYVETDASGHFLIDRLGWGRYRIFANKEASAYPDTHFSFYDGGSIPETAITRAAPTADVQIRLGPKAGILTGSVTNAETAAPVNARFKLIRTTPADNWFSTSQAADYRVLLPSATDVLIEVSSPGYKTWTSSGPLRLQAGGEMHLDISLEVSRDPSLPVYEFMVPNGYVGWLRLESNVKDTPSASVENKLRIFKFPVNGALATSSTVPEEGAEKRYFYYSEKRSSAIPTDYRHGRGMVWGETQGDRGGVLSQFYFFVGTEEQYRKQGYRGLQGATTTTSPLDVSTPDFTLDDKSILTGIQMLNKESLGIGFGFEEILGRKVSDPEVPAVKITVRLLNPSTREILNALCAADPRYTWTLDGLTVNVFPSSTMTDSKYLLDRELSSFRVNGITEIDQGLLAIAQQLPGPMEQIAHSQVGGDASYPNEPWSATFEHLTVRQAINRLVEHMGSSSFWFFGGSDEFRYLAFYKGAFHRSR